MDVEEEDETELEPSPTTDQPKIHGEKTSLNRIHSSPIPISSKMEVSFYKLVNTFDVFCEILYIFHFFFSFFLFVYF